MVNSFNCQRNIKTVLVSVPAFSDTLNIRGSRLAVMDKVYNNGLHCLSVASIPYVTCHIPVPCTLSKNVGILMMATGSIVVFFRFQILTYDEIQTTGARITDIG